MSKKLHLYLDADTSSKALHSALLKIGHDIARTPAEWMPLDASDKEQLPGATAQGRAIFTYNIRDFTVLGNRFPHHGGIILAFQKSMNLRETESDKWTGQIRWLNDRRSQGMRICKAMI